MQNRFRRSILPNLDKYEFLSAEDKRRILKSCNKLDVPGSSGQKANLKSPDARLVSTTSDDESITKNTSGSGKKRLKFPDIIESSTSGDESSVGEKSSEKKRRKVENVTEKTPDSGEKLLLKSPYFSAAAAAVVVSSTASDDESNVDTSAVAVGSSSRKGKSLKVANTPSGGGEKRLLKSIDRLSLANGDKSNDAETIAALNSSSKSRKRKSEDSDDVADKDDDDEDDDDNNNEKSSIEEFEYEDPDDVEHENHQDSSCEESQPVIKIRRKFNQILA